MENWIKRLFDFPHMMGMGHGQSADDQNLGLGWIYYGLVRANRPKNAVVIGSYRGFVPLVIGKAMQDNASGGTVTFIDPSMVDEFWTKPECVQAHFQEHGVNNVRHHLATTQAFVESDAFAALSDIGLLFIDGYHTDEFAKFDHDAFAEKLSEDAIVLFHDSVRERTSRMYGEDKAYVHTVCRYMAELRKDPAYEVLSLPLADGLTLVKRVSGSG